MLPYNQALAEGAYAPMTQWDAVLTAIKQAQASGGMGMNPGGDPSIAHSGYFIPGMGTVAPAMIDSRTGQSTELANGLDGGAFRGTPTMSSFAFQEPGQTGRQLTKGTRNPDGTIKYTAYERDDVSTSPQRALAVAAAMYGAGQLFGPGGMGSGLGGSAGGGGSGLGGAGGYAGAAGDFGLLTPGASSVGAGSLGTIGAAGAGSGIGGTGINAMLSAGIPASTTGAAASGGGLLSSITSAISKPGVMSALGGLAGAVKPSSTPSGSTTETRANQIDPRMAEILYGADGKSGILNQIAAGASNQQPAGNKAYGEAVNNFMQTPGFLGGVKDVYGAASGLTNSNIAAPRINNPGQNSIKLKDYYTKMLDGDPGANPYLTGAIGKGINQSNVAFQQMLSDATRNLTQNVLPSIRGGAMSAGQYGGSRQGISEGQGLTSFNQGIDRAISQANQGNTDSAVSAQSGSYESGMNRNASLISQLSAQQYGAAQNQAQLQAQTNQLNSANRVAGIGAQSGLMGDYYNQSQAQKDYGMGQAGKAAGLLSNYSGLGGSSTNSTPYYSNKAGNIIGGITAGLGLYNAFKG